MFAKEGAKVTVSDINEEAGKKVVEEIITNGGEAIFVKANTAGAQDSRVLWKKPCKLWQQCKNGLKSRLFGRDQSIHNGNESRLKCKT